MAIPIIHDWEKYFSDPHEGLGSSYERIILNELIFRIADRYNIRSALETPAFGFTGLSGINLLGLALKSVHVCLEDHDDKRLELIKCLWNSLGIELKVNRNTDYTNLAYPDKSIDLGFNFSALWFVSDLQIFLTELSRTCQKAILLCVPNRSGIGYKMQIKDYSKEKYPSLHPEFIDPQLIQYHMKRQGWRIAEKGYIDCPPWPDIGMNKELWLAKLMGRNKATDPQPKKSVSILPYYRDRDPGFKKRMLSLSLVERKAPKCFKLFWAHHYYMLFLPD